MKKHFYKTVAMIMVCMTMSTSLFASSRIKVCAAALPSIDLSMELVREITLALYGIYESGMLVSNASAALDKYDESMNAYDAFRSFVYEMTTPDAVQGTNSMLAGTQFRDVDGNVYIWDEYGNAYTTAPDGTVSTFGYNWGTSARELIDEDTFANYRVIAGGSGNGDDSGDDSGDEPDGGDDDNVFTHLQQVMIGTGFLGVVGNFISNLFKGETELEPATYYTGVDYMYTGKVPQDANGYYLYRGTLGPSLSNGRGLYYINETMPNIFVGFIEDGFLQFGYVNDTRVATFNCLRPSFNSSASSSGLVLREDSWQNLNFPIFPSEAEAINYYLTGDASAAVNAPAYDFPDMAESVPETLHPVTGISFSPNQIPGINHALKSAADAIPEADAASKDTNTSDYKNTMIAVLEKHVAENMPESEPEPEPVPEPEPGIIDYSDILNKIYIAICSIASSVWNLFREPLEEFQKSFDKIYDGILRIIEILPHQIELVRGNIVTLPQSIFDLFASPLAAIQDALAGFGVDSEAGLWANLQPYLDAFKNALADLAPAPAFDFDLPGGGDGTGGAGGGDDGNGNGSGFKFTMLLDGLILIILILLALLMLFLHCMEFIVNIFQIPATTGFLPEDMVTGFEYIKSLEIPGIGMSVFDFMMGLVYIILVFGVIRVLRKNINYIRIER